MSARWQLTAITLCLILAAASRLHADIYRWDNGQVIPGTEGITPGPGVQLDHKQLEYAKLGGWNPGEAMDLTGAIFEASNLTNANLSVSTLTSANLTGANLTNANLSVSTLTSANLTGANLTNANLTDSTLTNANLTGAVVTGTAFHRTTSRGFTAAQFYSTQSYHAKDLSGIGLGNNDLTGWDFREQNLTNAIVEISTLTNANLTGANLTNANLSVSTLTSANLTGANLTNANLTDSTLTNANLTGAVVTGTAFHRTTSRGFTAAQFYSTQSYHAKDLSGIGLGDNDLTGWDFSGQDLTNATLYQSTLTNANLTGANFTNAIVELSTLTNANLTGAVVTGTYFNDTTSRGFTAAQLYSTQSHQAKALSGIGLGNNDLTGWDFREQNLTNAGLDFSTLTNANLAGAVITGTRFNGTTSRGFTAAQLYSTQSYQAKTLSGIGLGNNDLTGWDFSGQNLTNATLYQSTLTNANLTGAIVTGTDFWTTTSRGFTAAQLYSTQSYRAKDLSGIRLSNNDLTGWDFRGQNLTNAGLRYSVLTNADLTGANLTNADLSESTLTSANLTGTNLKNAYLSDVNGLTSANFSPGSVYNQWTEFPEGFSPAAAGLTMAMSPTGDLDADDALDADDVDVLANRIGGRGSKPSWLPNAAFDMNGDNVVSADDHRAWVQDVKRTWYGDANLDLKFTSTDMVDVLAAGKYEIGQSAGWSEGDWNGDGLFDSNDVVTAFVDGGYEMGPRTDVAAVPEPGGVVLLIMGLVSVLRRKTTAHSRV